MPDWRETLKNTVVACYLSIKFKNWKHAQEMWKKVKKLKSHNDAQNYQNLLDNNAIPDLVKDIEDILQKVACFESYDDLPSPGNLITCEKEDLLDWLKTEEPAQKRVLTQDSKNPYIIENLFE